MDSAGFVSDEVVQTMWGKILGKEFEKPGSTPSNMIRILSEITPVYAQAFRKICSMQMITVTLYENGKIKSARQDVVVPYSNDEKIFSEMGLTFSVFNELETLGLIKFDTLSGYVLTGINEKNVLLYVNGETLEIEEHKENKIPIGSVMLTAAGMCLKNITPIEMISGYSDLVKKYIIKERIKLKEHIGYRLIKEGGAIRCEKIG